MLRGLGHYQLLGALSQGGQASVFLAQDRRLDRKVCIKVYHLQGSLSSRRLLEREAHTLASIESPRVIDVLDVIAVGSQLALVTRYVEGCTLEELITHEGPLSLREVLSIGTDVAEALAALQQRRLVHGDLRAANIFIGKQGAATVGDFGAAVLRGQRVEGFSLEALAPEQLSGSSASARSDYFALGLLLYRSLTGRHPFFVNGVLDTAALQQGLSVSVAPVGASPEATQALNRLLMELLAPDPALRPASPLLIRQRITALRSLLIGTDGGGDHRLAARVRETARQRPVLDVPLQLPATLQNPPWRFRLADLVVGYWRASSLGARLFAGSAISALLVIVGMATQSPQTCIAIADPVLSYDATSAPGVRHRKTLRAGITTLLKESSPDAMVLGEGPDSDSMPTLTAYGMRDRCVAQRSLQLRVTCMDRQCRYEMTARAPSKLRVESLELPVASGQRRLVHGLEQLIEGVRSALEP